MPITTDWDKYYQKPYKTASYSRRITGRFLIKLIGEYVNKQDSLTFVELGGANSCFFDLLNNTFNPEKYIIIDNNQLGLDRFRERVNDIDKVELFNQNIVSSDFDLNINSDLTFSIGLIEHFSVEKTKIAILSHLKTLKQGGILIISFPTPTFLYKITRKFAELLGLWIFHDERPLLIQEVTKTLERDCDLLSSKIVWPIFLTQAFIVLRKR